MKIGSSSFILAILLLVCLFTGTASGQFQTSSDRETYSDSFDVYTIKSRGVEKVDSIIDPDSVIAAYGRSYTCDGLFEVQVVNRPTISDFLNRDTGKDTFMKLDNGQTIQLNPVYDAARTKDSDTLFQMRIKFRNLSYKSINGLKKESFVLSGYVRNRKVSYNPILIQNYDWAEYAWRSERQWDIENPYVIIGPLRELDVLVVFQVHPFLYNWELTVSPKPAGGSFQEPNSYEFSDYTGVTNWKTGKSKELTDAVGPIVSYPDIEPPQCELVFRLTEVLNTNTDTVMKTIPNP